MDDEHYFTGNTVRSNRWRINDNLLGGQSFCPIVQRTQAMATILAVDLKKQINELKEKYSPEIFNRATQNFYRKETR